MMRGWRKLAAILDFIRCSHTSTNFPDDHDKSSIWPLQRLRIDSLFDEQEVQKPKKVGLTVKISSAREKEEITCPHLHERSRAQPARCAWDWVVPAPRSATIHRHIVVLQRRGVLKPKRRPSYERCRRR